MARPRFLARIRRFAPELVLGLVVVLGAITIWQAFSVISHVRDQARQTSRIYGQVAVALEDPDTSNIYVTLLALVGEIRATGIPLVVTDANGHPTAVANTPFAVDDARLIEYVEELDRSQAPIAYRTGELHFGALPAALRLSVLTYMQLSVLALTILVGIWAYRSAVNRDRDRLWVAMARESAHQLGTPLMSAEAWVDRLEEGTSDASAVAGHLRGDLERLNRVAQRFERIGRPARRDRVSLGATAERIAAYFQPRLPKHANAVALTVNAPDAGPTITADQTLIEWALESLVRNAIDALSGRGGTIEVSVDEDASMAYLRVSDDGPGIPLEVRATLFEPGITTKTGGWGIGLALAKRIVDDVHGGRLTLDANAAQTVFIAALPKTPDHDDD
jgi:signal transduction histidine kinase